MTILTSALLVALGAAVTPVAAQYPVSGNVIVITGSEVEREKVRAYENRTKALQEVKDHLAEESRSRAYEEVKRERRAKVRRLRGK